MTTLTDRTTTLEIAKLSSEKYEIIENELIESCNFKELTISGSLFSLTLLKNVTFQSCVFFASKIENCEFFGCHFDECEFQFTGIDHCNFAASSFENCKWDLSPIKKSIFISSFLDEKTAFAVSREENSLQSCFNHEQRRTLCRVA